MSGSVARGAVDSSAKQRARTWGRGGVLGWGAVVAVGVRLVCGVCEGSMYFILSWAPGGGIARCAVTTALSLATRVVIAW